LKEGTVNGLWSYEPLLNFVPPKYLWNGCSQTFSNLVQKLTVANISTALCKQCIYK